VIAKRANPTIHVPAFDISFSHGFFAGAATGFVIGEALVISIVAAQAAMSFGGLGVVPEPTLRGFLKQSAVIGGAFCLGGGLLGAGVQALAS